MTQTPFDQQVPVEFDPATGLPIGPRSSRPAAAPRPERVVLEGRFARLEPLDPARHGEQLFAACMVPDAAARFLYLPVAGPLNRAEFDAWIDSRSRSADPFYFAVVDKRTGRVEGRQSLLRIDPANQSIEIGDIYWGPAIARTAVTTEANFLFASYAFDQLGYRRYEWKCNALNAPSRRAAERFGFTCEGHFRRAAIVKGRTRDTVWFSIVDEEWPAIRRGTKQWLAAANFDAEGRQRRPLAALIASAGSDPVSER